MRNKNLLVFLLIILGCMHISAQSIDVNASIDTNFLLIGEQTQIELKAQYKLDGKKVSVEFPELTDTINEFIEVIAQSKIDTTYPNPNDLSIVEQTQRITITSFDSGSYTIPYFEFAINEGIYQTGSIQIEVQPLQVDTANAIFDIKGPIEEPFSIVDWVKNNWPWLAAGVALVIVIIFLIRFIKNRPEKIIEKEIVPEIPAHITALDKLEKLQEEKLWQSGKVKRFHSEISEIIREYLEKRYAIQAMENTTDEIMQGIRYHGISSEQTTKLNKILVLSDLVKFAKEKPLANENDSSLNNAVAFVTETQPIIEKEETNAV
jgi:hypothetical protein